MEPSDTVKDLARKNATTAILLGIIISPIAYVYVGKWKLAIANFLTLNWFLTGFVVVPYHCHSMITDAQQRIENVDSSTGTSSAA